MKIAVIGGGSSYTPELLEGALARAEALSIGEVCLHDVNGPRLEAVHGFCLRMARAAGAAAVVSKTIDLEKALAGADFVVAQIRVGGAEARKKDELLGARHGLIGQETTGVGGFAKALRTIPAMLDICRSMERNCPEAGLVNFTNPSGIVTEAVLNHSRVKAVGLCNIPLTFHLELARALGVDRDELDLDYVGLNHLSWVRRVRLKGEDVTGRVLGWAGSSARPANLEEIEYPAEFLKALGMVPMHYLRYYYLTRTMIEKQGTRAKTRAEEVMEIEAALMKIYADPARDKKPEELGQRGGANYSAAALQYIESAALDRGDKQVLITLNGGAIPDLPGQAAVELYCRVGRGGASPIPVGGLPLEIKGLMHAVKSYETLTVKAAVEGSRDAAIAALAVHPLGPDADAAARVLDDILETHAIRLESRV